MSDSELVRFSSFSYLPEVEQVGIKMFRFQKGFLHEKVVLVDEDFASVGSANFDNRSFRLNFEITLAVRDRAFAASVEDMFERDFANSTPATAADLTERNFFFRLAVRVARLLSPIQ
jgi:cardiolipin synthase A/B